MGLTYTQTNDAISCEPFEACADGDIFGDVLESQLEIAAEPGSSEQIMELPSSSSFLTSFMQTVGGIGEETWQAGTYEINFNVTTASNDIEKQGLWVCRVNQSCGVVDTVGSDMTTTAMTDEGVYTFSANGSESVGDASDDLYIILEFSNSHNHASRDVGITPDQIVETPIESTVTAQPVTKAPPHTQSSIAAHTPVINTNRNQSIGTQPTTLSVESQSATINTSVSRSVTQSVSTSASSIAPRTVGVSSSVSVSTQVSALITSITKDTNTPSISVSESTGVSITAPTAVVSQTTPLPDISSIRSISVAVVSTIQGLTTSTVGVFTTTSSSVFLDPPATTIGYTTLTPSTINAVDTTDTDTIELSWQDNSAKEDGFRVYRAHGESVTYPDSYDLQEITEPNTTTYTDTDVSPQWDTIHYAVTAFADNDGALYESDPTQTTITREEQTLIAPPRATHTIQAVSPTLTARITRSIQPQQATSTISVHAPAIDTQTNRSVSVDRSTQSITANATSISTTTTTAITTQITQSSINAQNTSVVTTKTATIDAQTPIVTQLPKPAGIQTQVSAYLTAASSLISHTTQPVSVETSISQSIGVAQSSLTTLTRPASVSTEVSAYLTAARSTVTTDAQPTTVSTTTTATVSTDTVHTQYTAAEPAISTQLQPVIHADTTTSNVRTFEPQILNVGAINVSVTQTAISIERFPADVRIQINRSIGVTPVTHAYSTSLPAVSTQIQTTLSPDVSQIAEIAHTAVLETSRVVRLTIGQTAVRANTERVETNTTRTQSISVTQSAIEQHSIEPTIRGVRNQSISVSQITQRVSTYDVSVTKGVSVTLSAETPTVFSQAKPISVSLTRNISVQTAHTTVSVQPIGVVLRLEGAVSISAGQSVITAVSQPVSVFVDADVRIAAETNLVALNAFENITIERSIQTRTPVTLTQAVIESNPSTITVSRNPVISVADSRLTIESYTPALEGTTSITSSIQPAHTTQILHTRSPAVHISRTTEITVASTSVNYTTRSVQTRTQVSQYISVAQSTITAFSHPIAVGDRVDKIYARSVVWDDSRSRTIHVRSPRSVSIVYSDTVDRAVVFDDAVSDAVVWNDIIIRQVQ